MPKAASGSKTENPLYANMLSKKPSLPKQPGRAACKTTERVIVKNRENGYYLAIILAVMAYLAAAYFSSDIGTLSTIITTSTALIAAVAFWMQLKRTENLDEANFIMNLNDQFISNDEMTRVERALELYPDFCSLLVDPFSHTT